jgi:microcystin-dependent protein
MPDTYTPNLNLVLPEIGASRDSWGTKLNQNTTTIDQYLSFAAPIGMIADFAGPNAPSGWLVCDGRLISRTTYSALFAVIGTYWGTGDGSTTFALPNPNGRSLVGPGTVIDAAGVSYGFSFTETTGFVSNTIAQANLPNYALSCDVQGFHYHGGATVGAGAHSHTTDAQGLHNHDTGGGGGGASAAGDHTHTGYTDVQGAHSHNYLQFYEFPGSGVGSGSPAFANQNAQTDVQGNHQHNVQTYNAGTHTHYLYWDGNHAHNVYGVGNHVHGISGDGSHAHNVYLNGSGVALEVLSPVLVVTKIIYAGQQAAALVALDAAAVTTIEGRAEPDELAAIREELAALRALFAPPGRRRLLSAPSRGPH